MRSDSSSASGSLTYQYSITRPEFPRPWGRNTQRVRDPTHGDAIRAFRGRLFFREIRQFRPGGGRALAGPGASSAGERGVRNRAPRTQWRAAERKISSPDSSARAPLWYFRRTWGRPSGFRSAARSALRYPSLSCGHGNTEGVEWEFWRAGRGPGHRVQSPSGKPRILFQVIRHVTKLLGLSGHLGNICLEMSA